MRRFSFLIAAASIGLGSTLALAEETASHWNLQVPAQLEWRAADSLPPGAQVAVLEGDPSKEGFFTMRIKMPDGYRVPAHWHPKQERITVLSGILNLGSGDTFDEKKAKALSPGTYSSMPPKMTHFAWMTGETILQVSSLGPWTITYVNPADDPRKK
jgi:quercetin dioxygenase-like cupin family protein